MKNLGQKFIQIAKFNKQYYFKRAAISIGFLFVGLKTHNMIFNSDTKFYTYDEISKHNSKDKRIWVKFKIRYLIKFQMTFKDEVFDVTDFVENHPGG